ELEVAAARIDDLLLHNRILKRSRDAALSKPGLYPLYNELIDLIGECAVTDEMSCGVCRAEEGDDHHDSCPIGIIEEWAHNNLARESPPANAEALPAVDVSAVELIAGDFGWTPEDVAEFLNDDDEVVAVTIDERIYEAVAAERAKQ